LRDYQDVSFRFAFGLGMRTSIEFGLRNSDLQPHVSQ